MNALPDHAVGAKTAPRVEAHLPVPLLITSGVLKAVAVPCRFVVDPLKRSTRVRVRTRPTSKDSHMFHNTRMLEMLLRMAGWQEDK